MTADGDHDPFADLPSLDAPELGDVPALPGAGELQSFRQIARQIDPRLRRRLTRWQIVTRLLRDPQGTTTDLIERLSAWPSIARQYRLADDPAERAHRREARARAVETMRARRQARARS